MLKTRTRRRLIRLVFALIPVTVLLVAAEIGSRRLIENQLDELGQPVGVMEQLYRPGNVHRPLNKEIIFDPYSGFRAVDQKDPKSRRPAKPPFPEKKPGEVRVICMGDSVTHGLWLKEYESWPALLQKHMNDWAPAGVRFEVYNGGVPGYGGRETKRLLQSRYMDLKPDIVLFDEEPTFADSVELPAVAFSQFGTNLLRRLSKSALIYLLVSFRPWNKAETDGAYNRMLYNMPGIRSRKGYYKIVYPHFVDWCKKQGIAEVLGVEYLTYTEDKDGKKSIKSNRFLWQLVKGKYIPTFEAFNTYPDGPDALFMDFIHFSAKGSDLQAKTVSDYLQRRWPHTEKKLAEIKSLAK